MERLNVTDKELEKKVEELHDESKELLSELNFMVDELKFFNNLLRSYSFVPHTKELFEDSSSLVNDLEAIKKKNEEMRKLVSTHDNELGGMMECDDDKECILTYIGQHKNVKDRVQDSIVDFKDMKRRVFAFLNEILEKKKS